MNYRLINCNIHNYRALGQGAFGEVYQGFYKTRAGDAVEMPVAVKVILNINITFNLHSVLVKTRICK